MKITNMKATHKSVALRTLALAAVAATLCSVAWAAISFGAPIVSDLAGPGVGDVMALGDLNLDCIPDLMVTRDNAVASETPGLISRFGDGLGGLPDGGSLSVGRNLSDVELVDLNGDGILDLVVTENFDPPASVFGPCTNATPVVPVLLGDGAGGFTLSACLEARDHPNAVAASDFDEDGLIDLVVINAPMGGGGGTSPEAVFFRGLGNGTFMPAVTVFDQRGHEIEVADLDGDRHLDVVVAGDSSGTFTFLGAGDGSLGTRNGILAARSREIAIGDVNGDGAPDVATVGSEQLNNSDDVVWISLNLNDGSGGFATSTSYLAGAHPFDVALGDFDGDGFDDVVTANNLSDSVSVLPANPDGSLQAQQQYPAGIDPMAVIVADYDRDGLLDVAVANRNVQGDGTLGDGQVSVLLQNVGGPLAGVATDSLPDGEVGQAYAQCLTALEGTAPYEWTLTVGALPTGLTFDSPAGRIHGTPSIEETRTFTVHVDDAVPDAAERQLTLRVCIDADGDGVNTCDADCDDADPDRFPGNPEVCDGKDNDCDTVIDSGLDGDGDGVDDLCDNCPSASNSTQADNDNDGFGDACDDCPVDPNKIAPGACGCGFADTDGDGDGTPDCIDACPADPDKIDPGTCGCGVADTDTDFDGLADCQDCDDQNPNCTTDCTDLDDDGFCVTTDCNDGSPSIFPGAPEIGCDGVDNDCSPSTPDVRDGDGDFYACDVDCNDGNAAINPAAAEIGCDGIDNDCSAATPDVRDGDGDSIACDVDCNDFDSSSWAVPGEALSVAINVVTDVISWNEPLSPGSVGGIQYDVIRSSNAGEFFSTAVCVESDDGTNRTALDVGVPAPWRIYYYLIRPQNACGEGDLGLVSGGAARTAISCPVGP
jgi:hypothetical protein